MTNMPERITVSDLYADCGVWDSYESSIGTGVAYVRADLASMIVARSERKIRWLRGMVWWAVWLAKDWRNEARLFAEVSETQSRKAIALQAENAALREAGRGLVELLDNHLYVIDNFELVKNWRKVDPQ